MKIEKDSKDRGASHGQRWAGVDVGLGLRDSGVRDVRRALSENKRKRKRNRKKRYT